ncbi:unnamed protein product [Urochloa humidicola]
MKSLLPAYRSLTSVDLADGVSTSFWHVEWLDAGPLKDVLPVLFSHCSHQDISVHVVVMGGTESMGWPPRLTSAASHELQLLEHALPAVQLIPGHDTRFISDNPSSAFTVSTAYDRLRTSSAAPHFGDINWANFTPAKVQIAFWILRHGRTRTRASLHRTAMDA